MNKGPGTLLLESPKAGDRCLFKYGGEWERGVVQDIDTGSETFPRSVNRIAVTRPHAVGKQRKSLYWLSRW